MYIFRMQNINWNNEFKNLYYQFFNKNEIYKFNKTNIKIDGNRCIQIRCQFIIRILIIFK